MTIRIGKGLLLVKSSKSTLLQGFNGGSITWFWGDIQSDLQSLAYIPQKLPEG